MPTNKKVLTFIMLFFFLSTENLLHANRKVFLNNTSLNPRALVLMTTQKENMKSVPTNAPFNLTVAKFFDQDSEGNLYVVDGKTVEEVNARIGEWHNKLQKFEWDATNSKWILSTPLRNAIMNFERDEYGDIAAFSSNGEDTSNLIVGVEPYEDHYRGTFKKICKSYSDKTTLGAALTANATSFVVTDSSKLPESGLIKIDDESMRYTENDTSTNTISGIVRGVLGSTAALHADSSTVSPPYKIGDTYDYTGQNSGCIIFSGGTDFSFRQFQANSTNNYRIDKTIAESVSYVKDFCVNQNEQVSSRNGYVLTHCMEYEVSDKWIEKLTSHYPELYLDEKTGGSYKAQLIKPSLTASEHTWKLKVFNNNGVSIPNEDDPKSYNYVNGSPEAEIEIFKIPTVTNADHSYKQIKGIDNIVSSHNAWYKHSLGRGQFTYQPTSLEPHNGTRLTVGGVSKINKLSPQVGPYDDWSDAYDNWSFNLFRSFSPLTVGQELLEIQDLQNKYKCSLDNNIGSDDDSNIWCTFVVYNNTNAAHWARKFRRYPVTTGVDTITIGDPVEYNYQGCINDNADINVDSDNANIIYVSCHPSNTALSSANDLRTAIESKASVIKKFIYNSSTAYTSLVSDDKTTTLSLDTSWGTDGEVAGSGDNVFNNITQIKSREHPDLGHLVYVLDEDLSRIIILNNDASIHSSFGDPPKRLELEIELDSIKAMFADFNDEYELGFGFYDDSSGYNFKREGTPGSTITITTGLPSTNLTTGNNASTCDVEASYKKACILFSIRPINNALMQKINFNSTTRKIEWDEFTHNQTVELGKKEDNENENRPAHAILLAERYFEQIPQNTPPCQLQYLIIFHNAANNSGNWGQFNLRNAFTKINNFGLDIIFVSPLSEDHFKKLGDKAKALGFAGNIHRVPRVGTDNQTEASMIAQIESLMSGPSDPSNTYTSPVINYDTSINSNVVYQANFSALADRQWLGNLSKSTINATTNAVNAASWNASIPASNSRQIWTVFPDSDPILNNFNIQNATQIGGLFTLTENTIPLANMNNDCNTIDNINGLTQFVRGVDHFDYDQNNNCANDRSNRLADIYHSEPVVVGPPDSSIQFIPGTTHQESYFRSQNNYAAFVTTNATRARRVYVASNDGLLHAFNDTTGAEEWAFLPPFVASQLPDIFSATNISTAIYALDGSPVVHDVFFNNSWRTILFINYGRGGAGFSALDITNPATPTHLYSVYNDTPNETIHYVEGTTFSQIDYSGTNVPNDNLDFRKLGETWSNPKIVYYNDGTNDRYALVMGAGYIDPTNVVDTTEIGSAVFILDVENGKIIRRIDITDDATATMHNSTPNTPLVINADSARGLTFKGSLVYINDIEGKIAKINLTDQGTLYSNNQLFSFSDSATNVRFMFQSMEATLRMVPDASDAQNEQLIRTLWLFAGTGNHNNINDTTNADDNNMLIGIQDTDYPLPTVSSSLSNVDLSECLQANKGNGCFTIPSNWRIDVGTNKLTAEPSIYNRTVYFPIYEPPADSRCLIGDGYICPARDTGEIPTIDTYYNDNSGLGSRAGVGQVNKGKFVQGQFFYTLSGNSLVNQIPLNEGRVKLIDGPIR